MFAAMKVLVPIGVGIAGLVAFASKGNAATKPAAGSGATAQTPREVPTPRTGQLTTEQVVQQMTAAIASADPDVIMALAKKLEAAGFPQQAADLRGVATALSKVGAAAAGTQAPVPPAAPATPVSSLPTVNPATAPIAVPPPVVSPGLPTGTPATTLPEMVVTGTPPTAAERELASSVVIDQQSKPKWKENRNLVSTFQVQESRAGSYKNIQTGAAGKVDGLYGPGTALALAERYGIVPPNPKYWPTNPAPSLTAYKNRLLKLAAADPARATEWKQAATKAKVA